MAKVAPGGATTPKIESDDEPKAKKGGRVIETIKNTLDIYGDTVAPMEKLK
eukprot:CAMPEP_0205922562 /NCGR_PEP_ID=MMETSP1325-20131115/14693_1 /ASSEMBLY_ACC=CAM_ASM_000708 /TAXON_ID=236786 /ORGANISM="Florenciella sp., Strain RCC1007" /LENGTH=50 /DNA_ID=CAMNT_0053290593 /DNA_START=24 /DNA_END=173 /DNA_ORIENTATION=-